MHKGYHSLFSNHLGVLLTSSNYLIIESIFQQLCPWNAFASLTIHITGKRCSATSAIKPILVRVIWYLKKSIFQKKIILSTATYVKFLLFVKQVSSKFTYKIQPKKCYLLLLTIPKANKKRKKKVILELVACITLSLNPKIAVCCQTKETTE